MYSMVESIGLRGMDGYVVVVEVKIQGGDESCVIVGLPERAVKESKERVLAALHTCGVDLSDKKITIQLSPAERKKYSPVFDGAIAVAILFVQSMGFYHLQQLSN